MKFLSYFQLKESPFGESPGTRFFFPSTTHADALRKASWSIEEQKSFVLITGEAGSGKTLISRMIHLHHHTQANIALILNPLLSKQDLFLSICRDFGMEMPPGSEPTVEGFAEFLIRSAQKGRKNLLIVDEAQSLSIECLEFIRLLTNLETGDRKLLQIILIGQPELENTLARPELRQLQQRIFLHIKINGLLPGEVGDYIRHRIERAGGTNFVRFDSSAARAVFAISGGIPRLINKACEAALRFAAIENKRHITSAEIRRLPLTELGLRPRPPRLLAIFNRRSATQ